MKSLHRDDRQSNNYSAANTVMVHVTSKSVKIRNINGRWPKQIVTKKKQNSGYIGSWNIHMDPARKITLLSSKKSHVYIVERIPENFGPKNIICAVVQIKIS